MDAIAVGEVLEVIATGQPLRYHLHAVLMHSDGCRSQRLM
jgi:hypothetical protein